MKQSIKNTIMIGMAVVLVGTSAVTISYAQTNRGAQPDFAQQQFGQFEQNSNRDAFENFGQNGNSQSSDNSNQNQLPGNQQGSSQQPQSPGNQQGAQPPQMPDNKQGDSSAQSESQDSGTAQQKGTSVTESDSDAITTAQNSSDSLNTAQSNLPPAGFDRRGGFKTISALCYMFAAIQIAIILAILAYLIISRFNKRSYNEVIANMRNNQ